VTTKTLAKKIAHFALTKKASNVTVMDLRKLTDMTDFFVVCSADSDIQVGAVADAVVDGTDTLGMPVWHREGLSQRRWVLLDYVDVVVHIFHKEARRFYGLEKLWGDAPFEQIEDVPAPPRKKQTRKKAPKQAE
jgi:ribosome-associated protein